MTEVGRDPGNTRHLAKSIKVVIWVDAPPREGSEQALENWHVDLDDALYKQSFLCEIKRRVDQLIDESETLKRLNCAASVFCED